MAHNYNYEVILALKYNRPLNRFLRDVSHVIICQFTDPSILAAKSFRSTLQLGTIYGCHRSSPLVRLIHQYLLFTTKCTSEDTYASTELHR